MEVVAVSEGRRDGASQRSGSDSGSFKEENFWFISH